MLTEEYGEYGELGHHGWEQGSSCIIQLCTFGLSRGQTGLEHRPPFIGRCATAHLLQDPRGQGPDTCQFSSRESANTWALF